MKKIFTVFKNTLIRGILFLAPLLVLLVVADRVIDKLREISNPIADRLPYHSLFGIGRAYWAVFLILIFVGLVMGIIARLKIAAAFLAWLEDHVLSRMPGYVFMKQMAESVIGVDDKVAYKVVLFSIEDAWQLAYLIEEINDEMIVVYVPSSPDPREGNVFFAAKDRIKETTITYPESVRLLNCQGRGAQKKLKDLF